MEYVSVHHHSTFSYQDGYGLPDTHFKRAAELNMRALTLTEHGNVSSHVKAEQASKKYGVKALYGCELYTAPDKERHKWHLTAIAENQAGYQNLNRLVSASYLPEHFYQWPTVNGPLLAEFSEGLIVTSGCSDSLLSCTLLGGKSNGEKRDRASRFDMSAAEGVVLRFKELFGDGYYLETQQFPELERTRTLNAAFAVLSARTGVPLVATADCHYPFPEDNEMQTILHAAGRGNNSIDEQAASWEYDIKLTHPLSDKFIFDRLVATGLTPRQARQAIASTGEIADRANVVLPRSEPIRFPVKDGQTALDLIWDKLREGWRYRYPANKRMQAFPQEYHERLKYEMEPIQAKGFVDYFMVMSEAISWAKDVPNPPIPVGPGRGSSAASLVCYLLRITEVDPLEFPTMVFERFMDITRMDLPDIDVDFADDRRHEVVEHTAELYGSSNVGKIGNFSKFRGKSAVNAIARVYRLPYDDMETIKNLIVERTGGDSRLDNGLEDTVAMFPHVQEIFERYPPLANAIRLEGNYSGMSVTAAGLVISSQPITDTCAVYTRESGKDKRLTTVLAYDKRDAEYLGMLKADFLGLSTMGMIGIALPIAGMTLEELYRVPLDEPKTLQAFKENDVTGIFQFEGRATQLVNAEVSPDNFTEITDVCALSRPGPLFSHTKSNYVDVKHGRMEPLHLHPIVDRITASSKYQIVYQEQVLQVIREIGGFPVQRVGDIRKIISAKLGEASFNTMKQDFVDGALKLHGMPEERSHQIWSYLVTSATYSFVNAHAVAYTMISFWCQYLKQHHPLAFYTAQLCKVGDGKDTEQKRIKLLKDAVKHGINILPPDASISGATWTADVLNNAVRGGLTQIPGIAEKTAESMLAYREEWNKSPDAWGKLFEWSDYSAVSGIGPKTIDKILAFCADPDPFGVNLLERVLAEIRREISAGNLPGVPKPTHRSDEIPYDADNLNVVWIGVPLHREYKDAIEDQRSRSGQSIEEIRATIKDPHLAKFCYLKCIDDRDEEVYLRFNRWSFPKFEEAIDRIRIGRDVLVVHGLKRKSFGVSLQVKKMIIIDPEQD